VPSAVTYRVRQIEDALDVLLFDRSSRQARLTEAGAELLREGARCWSAIDAVANRVKRVATGWEPQFTIAADSIISTPRPDGAGEAFFALSPAHALRIRDETLSGTLEALTSGQADLALGVSWSPAMRRHPRQAAGRACVRVCRGAAPPAGAGRRAAARCLLQKHRAVAVADSVQRGGGVTIGLLGGQDVFTVPSMRPSWTPSCAGWAAAFLPEPMARPLSGDRPAGGAPGGAPAAHGAWAMPGAAPARRARAARCSGG
jgi:DNA-binding transcriptional LysR family regulator